ncbi:squalene-hopene/tetraprenyl-beta-curcumene cyclase [Rhodoligotrophos appendicifer]|uniref:squalene--hopene cyclase n=1 Tax=Rhodoligotrophos appendicifer TaxID=987056 RepID=UPI0011849CCA|nr:squalene--hopene cyclase [Rhodoligotrophos appendicifer]
MTIAISERSFHAETRGVPGYSDVDFYDRLDATIADAASALSALQQRDGHILFELEADATIPSEYIFFNHFMDELDPALEAELGEYLRLIQSDKHDGWSLYYDGDFNISASVKAYFALKLIGEDADAPHMVRARNAILAHGGAETANVFTRYTLTLFGQVPWHAIPAMPIELMLMPRWFPVNIWKFAYWSRTVIAPLLLLAAMRPRASNPTGGSCREIFKNDPATITQWQTNPTGKLWGEFFLKLDRLLHPAERHIFPRLFTRKRAIKAAVDFIVPRLNGEDGLGAIFPAMAYSGMAFKALGYPKDHPYQVMVRQSVDKLVVDHRETRNDRPRYVQPCVSPIWDTALAGHALREAATEDSGKRIDHACEWLVGRQINDVKGDWAINAPDLEPGGWAFQYRNDYYPDVDDTAVVGMLLHRIDAEAHKPAIDRALVWIEGMQSKNGGWGAFDIDNNADFLNSIPFADHGALLDPPTADVTARCLGFLAQAGYASDHPIVARGIKFLKDEQEEDGSWFGRWGTNYIYGTWSVLCALNAVGEDMQAPYVRKAVDWLLACQREDGGWGEDGASYWKERRFETKESTASQTAWALLGLMAAGEVDHPSVERGVKHILATPRDGANWKEPWYTAVGFPRVFYLRYHGYSSYFPIWALSRFRNLKRGNSKQVVWGL